VGVAFDQPSAQREQVGSIEPVKQGNGSHLIAGQLPGTASLVRCARFGRVGFEDLAEEKQGPVFFGRRRALERPFGLIESVEGVPKAFGGIAGRGPKGRADGGQPFGQLGHQASDHPFGWSALRLGVQRAHPPFYRTLGRGVKQGLERRDPALTLLPVFPLLTPSAKGGGYRMKATQQMRCPGKGVGDGIDLGVPAIGDNYLGLIAQRLELQQKEGTIISRIRGQ
jgi:hypothetical protein